MDYYISDDEDDYHEEFSYRKRDKKYKKRRPDSPKRPSKRRRSKSPVDDGSDKEDDKLFDEMDKKVFADENHIYFRAGVSAKSIDKLIEIINTKNDEYIELTRDKLLKKCEPGILYLHITSFGGSVLAAFRAIDAIERSKLPIHTIVDGHAASAGSMMAIIGKKKYMTPRSYVLIHELSTWFGGKYSELKDDMKNAKRMMDDIEKLYLDNTKISRGRFKECRKHDLWWGQEKCLDLGIVDELWK